jgi:DNA transformation protein
MLIEAGVPDVKTLRRLGPIGSYRRLRFHFGKRVSMNFIYAIECALRDLDWRKLEAGRKAELKAKAQLVAQELAALGRR